MYSRMVCEYEAKCSFLLTFAIDLHWQIMQLKPEVDDDYTIRFQLV